MTSPLFLSDDPDRLVEKFRRLADDIERIAAGGAPTAADLETAPILHQWALASIERPCLVGAVSGHPRLGARPLISTSDLYALDPHGVWARTFSRFYRLGRRLGDQEGAH